MVDEDYAVVNTSSGSTYYVRVLSTLDRELLKPNAAICLHKYSHAVVDILPPEADSTVQSHQLTEKPEVTYDVRWATGAGPRPPAVTRRTRSPPFAGHWRPGHSEAGGERGG